jgi:hypothetical protein
MNTNVKDNSKAVNNNTVKTDKMEQFVAGNPVNKDSAKPEAEKPKEEPGAIKTERPKAETPKAETPATPELKAEQPKAEEAKPQAEPTKKELKEQFREQQERKLADTVKLVEALGKKIAQKNKLQNTIGNLDSFTIAQNDDKDDMASDSRFHRCELIIHDDDGEEFVTKNPFIIAYVAHEVKQLCIDKLAEVEASIVIPF